MRSSSGWSSRGDADQPWIATTAKRVGVCGPFALLRVVGARAPLLGDEVAGAAACSGAVAHTTSFRALSGANASSAAAIPRASTSRGGGSDDDVTSARRPPSPAVFAVVAPPDGEPSSLNGSAKPSSSNVPANSELQRSARYAGGRSAEAGVGMGNQRAAASKHDVDNYGGAEQEQDLER